MKKKRRKITYPYNKLQYKLTIILNSNKYEESRLNDSLRSFVENIRDLDREDLLKRVSVRINLAER